MIKYRMYISVKHHDKMWLIAYVTSVDPDQHAQLRSDQGLHY